MNREEAKLILDAHTLAESAAEDPQLREAREWLSRDAELKKWFDARHDADERIAQAVAGVSVPEHLRNRLLGAMAEAAPANVVKFPTLFRSGFFLALAACIVIGLILFLHPTPVPGMPKWESDSLAMVQGLDSGTTPLDHKAPKLEELRGYLASAKAPEPESIPRNLTPHLTVGCKFFHAAGLPSSVVCFEIAPGVLAHLVTVSAGPGVSGAAVGKPEFAANGAWHTAVWSDGKKTYILGTRAQMDDLKKLFG